MLTTLGSPLRLGALCAATALLIWATAGAVRFGLDGESAAAQTPAYDLVIRNARVVDGTGNPWFRADVALRGGRVARIGRISADEGRSVLDARGMILAPGFIDVHTHAEGIYNQPEAENFVRMGVTSLVTGNCGSSTTNVGQFLGRMKERPLAVNLATLVGHNSVRERVMGEAARAPSPDELQKMEALVEQ